MKKVFHKAISILIISGFIFSFLACQASADAKNTASAKSPGTVGTIEHTTAPFLGRVPHIDIKYLLIAEGMASPTADVVVASLALGENTQSQ